MVSFLQSNSTYLAVLIGLLLGIPVLRMWDRNQGREPLWCDILLGLEFSAISVLSVLLFASLETLLTSGETRLGAVSTFGVYLLAPILLLIVHRKSRARRFDQFAIYAIPSLFLQRIRCMIFGCCAGKIIPGMAIGWPTREIELVFYLLVFVLFFYLQNKGKVKEGSVFPMLMIFYGVLRFIVEFMRDNGVGLFHLSHIWAVLTLIIGVSIYAEMKQMSNSREKSKH